MTTTLAPAWTLEHEGPQTLLRFRREAGLWQVTVTLDGSRVDWSALYVTLNHWGNVGARTGPWDFSPLDGARPVVPAFWVSLDDRTLGLWYTRRVTLDDIARKRFVGRLAFWLKSDGDHVLRFSPYRPMPVIWQDVNLQPDPEDRLLPDLEGIRDARHATLARLRQPQWWDDMRQNLATSHAAFEPLIRELVDWSMARWTQKFTEAQRPAPVSEQGKPDVQPMVGNDVQSHDVLVLTAGARLFGRSDAMDMARRVLDVYLNLPDWGNPRPDGYGHNGDMFAADAFRNLAWAYHYLHDDLSERDRRQLLDKLHLQAGKFLDMALLMRDYWGGSLLQDHGYQSLLCFANGALHLLGILPEARDWVRYALPRALRSVHAMPPDGVIPTSSHHSLSLYLDELSFFRDTYLAQSGCDIYDHAPALKIVDYLSAATLDKRFLPVWGTTADSATLECSQHFFNQVARKYRDGRARTIQQMLMSVPLTTDAHPMRHRCASTDRLWGLFSYDPAIEPAPLRVAGRRLVHYEDAGVVHFLDDHDEAALSLRCGPWLGRHAYRHATGPCDRMEIVPAPGHFTFTAKRTPLLVSPDAGYSLNSRIRSVLLIDDHGPIGDVGYPMSIPDWRDPGEHIAAFAWDAQTLVGQVMLELTPAYAPEFGVQRYARTFHFSPGRTIRIVDDLRLAAPRRLTWLFQTRRDHRPALGSDGRVSLGSGPRIMLAGPASLQAAIAPTPVVRSYTAQWGAIDFDHVSFTTPQPTREACVEFQLSWTI
jgi:hypothetical protein